MFLQLEKPIYEAFCSKEFVDKLVSYLSLEEQKEKDAFDNDRYYVFKVHTYLPAL